MCDVLHNHGLCCRKMSIYPSVTHQYYVKMAKHIIKLFVIGSHTILHGEA